MARGVGLSRKGGGGRLEEFWGGDVPLEPLAYTRPISNFFLPTIYLFITHLFGFL